MEHVAECDRPVSAGDLDRAVKLDHRQPPPCRRDRVALTRVCLLADQQLIARRLPGGHVHHRRLAGQVAARVAGRVGLSWCSPLSRLVGLPAPWGGARALRRLTVPGFIGRRTGARYVGRSSSTFSADQAAQSFGDHSNRQPSCTLKEPGMKRTDTASRTVRTTPDKVYAALIDPAAMLQWLPPTGMTAHLEHFDASAGGGYRMVLTYADGFWRTRAGDRRLRRGRRPLHRSGDGRPRRPSSRLRIR